MVYHFIQKRERTETSLNSPPQLLQPLAEFSALGLLRGGRLLLPQRPQIRGAPAIGKPCAPAGAGSGPEAPGADASDLILLSQVLVVSVAEVGPLGVLLVYDGQNF